MHTVSSAIVARCGSPGLFDEIPGVRLAIGAVIAVGLASMLVVPSSAQSRWPTAMIHYRRFETTLRAEFLDWWRVRNSEDPGAETRRE
jgi:hypothetical protein